MTTDITELAQREKFEAWFKSSFHPDKTGPYIKDQLYFAWKAAGAELVEALESEKRICATWRKTAESTSEKLEKAQTINAAAEKLVRCKGRYHSEQNYRALAALFGVTTPDLPPLDSESRTVTVKLLDCDLAAVQHMSGGSTDYCNGFVDGTQNAIRAMRAAGVDVREAE